MKKWFLLLIVLISDSQVIGLDELAPPVLRSMHCVGRAYVSTFLLRWKWENEDSGLNHSFRRWTPRRKFYFGNIRIRVLLIRFLLLEGFYDWKRMSVKSSDSALSFLLYRNWTFFNKNLTVRYFYCRTYQVGNDVTSFLRL